MCPIETPEGPNIGLIGSLSSYAADLRARLRDDAVPRGQDGKVTEEIVHLDATRSRSA
jgi:DNA-directed RNA polymerase subunit beta